MSVVAFERPSRRPGRVVRPAVHRRRPQAPAVPEFDERERAVTLVREALDATQLKTAIAQAAPARYTELHGLLRGMRYYSPQHAALAESLAVEGLLELGVVQLHNRAREIDLAIEAVRTEHARKADPGSLHDWQSRLFWGGPRRSTELDGLGRVLMHQRSGWDWDHSPAAGIASMPERAGARRYPVAPGLTATADDLVATVFGYWRFLDAEYDVIPPVIMGEVHAWFRALVHRLWIEATVNYAVVEYADSASVDAARGRAIAAERDLLARLLEEGDEHFDGIDSVRAHRFAMRAGERARLRFVEVHLSAVFGFDAYDARARRPRMDIAGARRWTR